MRGSLEIFGSLGTLTLGLVLSGLGAGCSAESGEPGAQGGSSTSGGAAGTAGASGAGASTGGAGVSGGSAGSGNVGGAGSANGGSAGSGAGGGGAGGAGGTAGSAGSSSGAGGGASDCTPNAAGTFVVNGDVVFDPKTCLTWMKANTSGDPYAAAEAYCAGLSLGGYDDWRLPTAGEVVSIFKCNNTYPPIADVFMATGDGIWTTTLSGTIAGDEPKVCGAGQNSGQYYDFGKVGGQNTRCVRGATTLPDRTDCKSRPALQLASGSQTNNQICAN